MESGVPLDEERRVVHVGELELHGLAKGRGQTVVFAHGLLCDQTVFEPILNALAGEYRVVAFDFRSHGRSAVARRPYSVADQGADILAVMDAFHVESAVLVGWSMGGIAALHAALSQPHRFRGLVLMSAAASKAPMWKRLNYHLLAGVIRRHGMSAPVIRLVTTPLFGRRYRQQQPDQVKRFQHGLRRLDGPGLAMALEMLASRPSRTPSLSRLNIPCLLVSGAQDHAMSPRESRRMCRRLPLAELVLLDNVGHMAPMEEPDRVEREIRAFLQGLRP
jgi:pimeloyl-ACP methyl ester carboxylesterase